MKCPTCKTECKSMKDNKYFPFCCVKCKDVDLYNWLFDVYDYQEEISNPPLVIEEEEKPEKFWRN